jgi:hypothetical protein
MSNHILPTSGNLLGLCFAVLSLIKVSGFANETIIDEVIAFAIVLFLLASIVSCPSMRSSKKEEHMNTLRSIFSSEDWFCWDSVLWRLLLQWHFRTNERLLR